MASMSILRIKNLNDPDSSVSDPLSHAEAVELGDVTVYREVDQPGWKWSAHHQGLVGTDWCEARHVGMVLSGRFGVLMRDGTTGECGPDDVFELPPGHDAWTIGDEPVVSIEWTGYHAWTPPTGGVHERVLTTILFTDLVGSTAMLVRAGDAAWREALSAHYETARVQLERFRGREVETTGDGLLATFVSPASALRCAAAIRSGYGLLSTNPSGSDDTMPASVSLNDFGSAKSSMRSRAPSLKWWLHFWHTLWLRSSCLLNSISAQLGHCVQRCVGNSFVFRPNGLRSLTPERPPRDTSTSRRHPDRYACQ